jgi:hypothetical protein
VKRFAAILFGLLLVWAQLLVVPAPACSRQPTHACCHCGGKMSCCAAQPAPCSPSAPAVPASYGIQNQFSFLAPALLAWFLPENEAGSISSAFVSPLAVSGAPLYARDCARLI